MGARHRQGFVSEGDVMKAGFLLWALVFSCQSVVCDNVRKTQQRSDQPNGFCNPHQKPAILTIPADLPFHKTVSFQTGKALQIILPDRQEVAIWCCPASSNLERSFSKDSPVVSYGEKPFEPLGVVFRPVIGGHGIVSVAESASTVIQGGGCVTGRDYKDYFFYVNEQFRVEVRLVKNLKGMPAVRVFCRKATENEIVDCFSGQRLKLYGQQLLLSPVTKQRVRGLHLLLRYFEQEQLGPDSIRNEYHPEGKKIRNLILGMKQDPDPVVRETALAMLNKLAHIPDSAKHHMDDTTPLK